MLNNIYNIFFIPEIFLACSSFVCLLFGLFLKKNAFRQTSNLAVFVLLLTILLVYYDSESNYAKYKTLLSHTSIINFLEFGWVMLENQETRLPCLSNKYL